MKLLLTSAGLTTPKLQEKFLDMVGKKPSDIKIGYIPTAAYPEIDRDWVALVQQPFVDIGITFIDADLKNRTKEDLYNLLEPCDVIWVSGGNTFYLLHWVRKSGLDQILPELLKTRVYLGVSAGSIVANPSITIAGWKGFDDPDVVDMDDLTGLGFTDFFVFPHDDQKWNDLVSENLSSLNGARLIRINDKQAVVVTDGHEEIL